MKYILRILVLPFVIGLILVKFNYLGLKRCYYFLLYGGEFINYEKDDSKTIKEIYEELVNKRIHI